MMDIKAKKMKLEETVVNLQEMQLAERMRRNEILLFTNGPSRSNSARALEYFELKQEEALSSIKKKMSKNVDDTSNVSILTNLVTPPRISTLVTI